MQTYNGCMSYFRERMVDLNHLKKNKITVKSLQSLFSVMALAGMGVSTAIGGITKGITGATAAGVSSFALRKTIIDMLNAAYESPESKIALSHALIGLFDSGSDATRKTIAETLQKLSQRAPQAISNNIGNNQKVSGPVISNYSNSAVTPGKTK